MKKAILSMMVLAALTTTKTNAQLKDNLSLGPIVGFGHSWDTYEYGGGDSKKFNPSFNGGVRLIYSATPNLGFGLDGTFRTEGLKVYSGYIKQTFHANYINIDPKLYYFFGRYGQRIRPKIGIGPNFGFLVGGTTRNVVGSVTTEQKTKSFYNEFNFAVSGTVGLNYRIKSGTWLNVDAVYNNGLSDLTKDGTNSPKSRSLFLNVGVTFGIGHAGKKGSRVINVKRKKA